MITGGEPARSHRASLALGICPSRTGTTTRPTAVVPGPVLTCMRPVQLAVTHTHTRPGDWSLDQAPRGCEREDSPVPPPSATRTCSVNRHFRKQAPPRIQDTTEPKIVPAHTGLSELTWRDQIIARLRPIPTSTGTWPRSLVPWLGTWGRTGHRGVCAGSSQHVRRRAVPCDAQRGM